MTLTLRPAHAQLNEGEFDAQRFTLANYTALRGRIQALSAGIFKLQLALAVDEPRSARYQRRP